MIPVNIDAKVNASYKELVYLLQTGLQTELSDKLKHDILSHIQQPAEYYKGLYKEHLGTTIQFDTLMAQLKRAGVYKGWIDKI